jgi:IS5 family transposase
MVWACRHSALRRLLQQPGAASFAWIDFQVEGDPDPTKLLKFHRRLETHELCKGLFAAINADLTARGLMLREGTLIAAPASTKNKAKQREPEMHLTRTSNQWYFEMKAHIGADRDSKLVHMVVVLSANVADVTQTAELLHGQDQQVHAGADYLGVEKQPEIVALEQKIDGQFGASAARSKTWPKVPRKQPSRLWRKPRLRCARSWSIPSTS